ncbi:5'-nucleotidase C-terminal domain-containing protein [Brachyspira hyodysenteriae]|nr:5'-nucleotidase C-terminal domain-containing protein [Brachyspira hyodysenteriae]MDA0028676.1 5'-nucleotidase C-terminal domain-containing protein [Brachyspira hyodysenteriae]
MNSGSLRGQLPSGKVTLGNMYEFFPFDNLIILTTLNGKDLKNILELSASKGEGAFLQVSKDCIINFDSKGKTFRIIYQRKSYKRQ